MVWVSVLVCWRFKHKLDIGFFAGGAGSGTGRRLERLRIDSSGNLTAVNTSSGGAVTLKVGANATSGVNNGTIIINNGGTGDAALQFDYENSAARAKIYVYRSTQDLIFDTAGSERLRINSAGNIGIGTITPNTGNPSGAKYLHIHNSDGSTNSNSPSEIYFTNANTGPSGGAGGLITFYNRGFYFWNYQNDDLHFGTGGNERFKFDHSANTLDFISTSKIRLKGSNASGTTHAHLNIGSDGAANSETRAIDIWGNWQDQESKSITYNHGSGANDMVCQQRVRYNSSPSSTYYEIGRFYHGQNTTAFPIKFISKSTTNANLELTGYIKASDQGVFQGVNSNDHELRSSVASGNNTVMTVNNNSYANSGGGAFAIGILRSASSAYSFAGWYSGNGTTTFSDREYNFRGDGHPFSDGSTFSNGADYAEYFEWSDGNPTNEDRRGLCVVLDGDKIREAVAGEDPIGVVSGNPSVVGDSAWNKWKGKHLRDEYGSYLLDENGERQLNPDYDPDTEYTSREDRPEWDIVGLMGKIRIRTGQVTGSRWIKMRDISANVQQWLVR